MACLSSSEKNKSEQYGFKIVPESMSDITADWCENILQKGSTISNETKVTELSVQSLTNDTDQDDGGGLSGATLLKLIPTYGGSVTGDEPKSMVCKITGNTKRDIAFIWRFITHTQCKSQFDEYISRNESLFYNEIVPLIKDDGYLTPRMYFVGLDDDGNSSFTEYVLLNGPVKTKMVMVMEDLSEWKSNPTQIYIAKEEMILCLKNVAILHAKFWGEKGKNIMEEKNIGPCKTEKDWRSARYSKIQHFRLKKLVASSSAFKKKLSPIQKWASHFLTKIPSGSIVPPWLTIKPLDDGSYEPLKDQLVKEMLDVVAQRIRTYYDHKLKHFIKKETQTLLHGDFHGGNHLYGKGENEGKIISLDYQMLGQGMVAIEFLYMTYISWGIRSFDEIEENAKEYHVALVKNGVKDYSLAEFLDELEMTCVLFLLNMINIFGMMKPETIISIFSKMSGEDKGDGFLKLCKQGPFNKSFIIMTCMYVKDKTNFLTVKMKE